MREVSPFVLASFRAVFGALLLTLVARLFASDESPPSRRDRVTLALLSLFGVVANQTLYISGLSRTTATNATLLVSTIPVFTVLVGLVSGVERPTRLGLIGVLVALAGVVVLVNPGRLDLSDKSLVGDVLIALNSLSYAIYLVAARRILARRSALSVIASVFRWGAIPILLLASRDLAAFRPAVLSGTAWAAIAGVVIFATVLAYSLNAWGLAKTNATTTAVFVYVQPLVAGTMAYFVLGERPGARTFAAAALIFAGVALTTGLAGLSKAQQAAASPVS